MKFSTWITRVNYALRGIDDDAPAVGTEEANYWGDTLNRIKDTLYRDLTKQWRASYKETTPIEAGTVATTGTTTLTGTNTFFTDYQEGDTIVVSGETVRTIDTITSDTVLTVTSAFSNTASGLSFTRAIVIQTGVQSYSLNRSFLGMAEKVYVLQTNGSTRKYYDVIQPQERNTTDQEVFVSDENPEKITFTQEIESTDPIVGGTLIYPAFFMPADVDYSDSNSLIPIPDPNWSVMAVASEVASADIVYEDKTADLNTKANALLSQMSQNNKRGTYGNPRITKTVVTRIPGTRRNY